MEQKNFFKRNLHISILLFILLLCGIFLPFLFFFPLLILIFIPLLLYFLLRKKFKRLGSFFLTLLLSMILGIIILLITGFVVYQDTLQLIDDIQNKPNYLIYTADNTPLFGYQFNLQQESFLPLTSEELLQPKNGVQLILTKSLFSNQNQTLLFHLEQDLPQEVQQQLFLQLLLETGETADLPTLFNQYKHNNIQIKPTYYILEIAKGVPLFIIEQIDFDPKQFIEEQPLNSQ